MLNKILSRFGYKLSKVDNHAPRESIQAFASEMELGLAITDHENSWKQRTIDSLLNEAEEIIDAVRSQVRAYQMTPDVVRFRMSDVGNLCMMVADNFGDLGPASWVRGKRVTK